MSLSRRVLRWCFALVACAEFTAIVWAFVLEPASLTVTEQSLNVPGFARRPLRVAVLTDLHVGSPFNGITKLHEVVDRTNSARPDLICVLGDLVIQGVVGGRFVAPEAIAAELARLRARAGSVAVLGNHDGWFDHGRVRAALEAIDVRVVEDTATKLETPSGPIWVAGVSDLWTGRHDLAAALAPIERDGAPVILLTHNPDVFPLVPEQVSLTLAGHTHGGQVRLPFVGRLIVPSRFGQRFAAGHIVEGGRHLFVATGIGTSILPVRFRVQPAVAILNLSFDQSRFSGDALGFAGKITRNVRRARRSRVQMYIAQVLLQRRRSSGRKAD